MCDVHVKLPCFRYFQTWFVIIIRTLMYENYLWTYCNMWLVVLNHVWSWFVHWFVWDPSWFHRTTEFIWVQVWWFDHFGDCYCTCALINWTVQLHRGILFRHVKDITFLFRCLRGVVPMGSRLGTLLVNSSQCLHIVSILASKLL